jgi:hypothetical protein
MLRLASLAAVALASTAYAQAKTVTLRLGTPVPLVTAAPLSSKTHAKGDMVELRTAADVLVDGVVAVPAGTPVTGQVVESRGTGGMGTTGHLAIRPLYITSGARIVRLAGAAKGSGRTGADTVLGMVLLTPLLSGRSAVIPAGTAIDAVVEKSVALPVRVTDSRHLDSLG